MNHMAGKTYLNKIIKQQHHQKPTTYIGKQHKELGRTTQTSGKDRHRVRDELNSIPWAAVRPGRSKALC